MIAVSVSKQQKSLWLLFLLAGLLFAIPLSPTLKSIFLVSALSGIFFTADYKRDLLSIVSEPWAKAAMALFLVSVLACFWSQAAYHTRWVFIEKYAKLLCLPVFVCAFQTRTARMMSIYAYLSAMLLTCMVSIGKYTGAFALDLADPGHVFHNHIVTGFMVALAAFLSGWLAGHAEGYKRLFWTALWLLFSYDVLFINTGRTGYVIYYVLMVVLLMHYLPFKYLAAGMIGLSAVFMISIYQSEVMYEGVQHIIQDARDYRQGTRDSSLGYRLSFHHYAKSLFLSRPVVGHGTGGFAYYFNKDDPVPSWPDKNLLDPHSQYWLMAADFGLLGIVALGYFFLTLLLAAFRLNEMKPVMLGLLAAFAVGNLSDSLLLYSVVGYLFVVFSALCLGE